MKKILLFAFLFSIYGYSYGAETAFDVPIIGYIENPQLHPNVPANLTDPIYTVGYNGIRSYEKFCEDMGGFYVSHTVSSDTSRVSYWYSDNGGNNDGWRRSNASYVYLNQLICDLPQPTETGGTGEWTETQINFYAYIKILTGLFVSRFVGQISFKFHKSIYTSFHTFFRRLYHKMFN